jgi:hypothetical protein
VTRSRLVLAVLAVAALAAWGIERLVVTDREAIEALLDGARASVLREDWDGIRDVIADDYAERGLDRDGAVSWIRDLWRRSQMKSLTLTIDEVRVEGDRAAARVTVSPGLPFAGARFGGRVELERRTGGWRITGMAPDDTGFLPR